MKPPTRSNGQLRANASHIPTMLTLTGQRTNCKLQRPHKQIAAHTQTAAIIVEGITLGSAFSFLFCTSINFILSSSSSKSEEPPRRRRTVNESLTQTSEPIWTSPDKYTPQVLDFTPDAGIHVNTMGFREIDFFNLFFSDNFISQIVELTNLYVDQFICKNPTSILAQKWIPTREIRTFWGLIPSIGISANTFLTKEQGIGSRCTNCVKVNLVTHITSEYMRGRIQKKSPQNTPLYLE